MKRNESFDWLISANTEYGNANRPAATPTFDIPAGLYVERDECVRGYCGEVPCDFFCWKLKWNKTNSQYKTVSPSGEILIEFIMLANETVPQEFARKVTLFAQKWGNLDICEEHQMPASHSEGCKPSIPHKKVTLLLDSSSEVSGKEQIHYEALSAWHKYAMFAKSILNITAKLQQGNIGENEDWEYLHSIGSIGWSHVEKKKEKNYRKNLLQVERELIANAVNYWLTLGNLRPEIRWENNNIIISFKSVSSYGTLFAYLALQLMLAVGKQDGLAICSACAIPYIPKRKPVSNKRRFCSQCNEIGKSRALASSDYRKRKVNKTFL